MHLQPRLRTSAEPSAFGPGIDLKTSASIACWAVAVAVALVRPLYGQTEMPLPATAKPVEPTMHSRSFSVYSSPGRVLAILRVGDHPPVPVVFDTGTSGNLIDRKLAARYALPETGPSNAFDGSLGKPVPGFETRLTGASLGGVPITDGPASAVDYDLPDEVGVFGPNSFQGQLVRMDLAAGRISVEPKSPATIPPGASLPYNGVGDDALPSVELDFGDFKLIAELDTGNNAAFLLPLSLAAKLSLEAPPVQSGWATSAAGRQPKYTATFAGRLKVGPLVLDRPLLAFIAGGRPNVGLPIVRQMVVVFDPSGRRNWLLDAKLSRLDRRHEPTRSTER